VYCLFTNQSDLCIVYLYCLFFVGSVSLLRIVRSLLVGSSVFFWRTHIPYTVSDTYRCARTLRVQDVPCFLARPCAHPVLKRASKEPQKSPIIIATYYRALLSKKMARCALARACAHLLARRQLLAQENRTAHLFCGFLVSLCTIVGLFFCGAVFS